MKYTVYHAVKPTFGLTKLDFPKDYAKVAIVEANDLDDVFKLTNNIDERWVTNPEVIEIFGDRFRSTSVGDVVVGEDGVANLCEPIGWKEILPTECTSV